MQMNGARNVATGLDATWAALNDPAVLQECIPGCEVMEATGPNAYRVVMTSRIGPVSARFAGRIDLSDIDPPTSYKLAFEGQGGATGFAKGTAHVGLVADGSATRVDYSVTAQVGGKLAQIGSRLIDAAASKVADDFFARFAENLSSRALAPDITASPSQASVEANRNIPEVPTKRRTGWQAIAVGIVACLVVYIAWLLYLGK